MGGIKGCGLLPCAEGDGTLFWDDLGALSAGREGLSPTQSLVGSGCLSLKVCARVCSVQSNAYVSVLVLVSA